ncbi:hypothetical protein FNU76_20600 [Chitinimonas arctica]|uniref:Amino acid ABC transporter substrate-binding protein n=1 Tax=Chitinimonas arctica TaxID=2594795 RepID=A0A516SK70_9NEIS|nr:hypothetical protein [Chitinimonas arctica]QDQ28557.1 hypothetical protein FNU76_20600 [Chitinimonas arctica]
MLRLMFRLLLACLALGTLAEPLRLSYLPAQNPNDKRYQYYWDLLSAALRANESQYGSFALQAGPEVMSPPRAAVEIARGDGGINVMVRTTSAELEKQLLPIRIPLDKGLTGYRLFLIRPQTQAKLEKVRTLSELARFGIGQDRQWVDTQILRAAGLQVVEGEGYAGLFRMLQADRFPLFSRGVNEIGDEYKVQRQGGADVAIEQALLLYYPLPRYFFVARTPEGELLAKRIENGLHKLIQTGEFERRYLDYKRLVLDGLQLSGRRVFRIANPTLSADTPLARTAWWDELGPELHGEKKPLAVGASR